MKWYIGQPIVAIKNHSCGVFKKGQEFIIRGLQESICNCKGVDINIGICRDHTQVRCDRCGVIYKSKTTIVWFDEVCFAPLDQDISELTEILTRKETV